MLDGIGQHSIGLGFGLGSSAAGVSEPVGDLDDRYSIADHREHCLVPLLHDTQLQQDARECHGSGGASVTHQAEPRNPSPGADVSRVRRNQTQVWCPRGGLDQTCDA